MVVEGKYKISCNKISCYRSDDLFELIGPFILNGCPDVKEGKVLKLCAALYDALAIPTSNTEQTILRAPVQMSNMSIADTSR